MFVRLMKNEWEKAADTIRVKFRSSVENAWSYLYTLEEDISN